jgi:hypothetical protein
MELVEFLLARIAEDEAKAVAAAAAKPGESHSHTPEVGAAWSADDGMVTGAGDEADLWEDEGFDGLRMAVEAAEHIARWDPARVLAECEAKRRIVAFYAGPVGSHYVLHFLALAYADHPDYREEWKP